MEFSFSGMGLLGFALIALFVLLNAFFSVKQQTVGIVERLGKFSRIARPGLNFKFPLIEKICGQNRFIQPKNLS